MCVKVSCVSPAAAPRAQAATVTSASHTSTVAASASGHGRVDALLRSVTRSLCLSLQGLPYKHLITHHQEPSHRHLISTYDDHYNRHNYNPGLPPRRAWSGHKLLWLPEKSDFPLLGIRLIWDFALCWAGRGPRLPRAVDAERLTQRALE